MSQLMGGGLAWNTLGFGAILREVGRGDMSEKTSVDTGGRPDSNGSPANGDNLIRRGDEERIISAVARHMEGVMQELNLDLKDPNK